MVLNNPLILLMEEILHHLLSMSLCENGIFSISTGAGFLPSTVGPDCLHGRALGGGHPETSTCMSMFTMTSQTYVTKISCSGQKKTRVCIVI